MPYASFSPSPGRTDLEGAPRCAASRVLSLAFTGYCHLQYCIVYGIQRGGRRGGVYCVMCVQWYCNSVGFDSREEGYKDDRLPQ